MFGSRNAFPLLDAFISRFAGSASNYEREFLKARASGSRAFDFVDFNGALAGDVTGRFTVAASSTATTWAILEEPGGWIRGVTGASVATAALQIYSPGKFFNGTAGAGFASRIRLSAVTNIRVEQGFVDVSPASGTTAVNYASNSFNSVTTGAVYLFDNGVAASSTVTGLYTIGVSTAMQTVSTTTNRYASAASLFVAMEIIGTTVKLWAGTGNEPLATTTAAFAASEAWLAWLGIKGLGASKNVDVDFLATWTNGRV